MTAWCVNVNRCERKNKNKWCGGLVERKIDNEVKFDTNVDEFFKAWVEKLHDSEIRRHEFGKNACMNF